MINFICFGDATAQLITIETNDIIYATHENTQNAFDEVFMFGHSNYSIQES